MQNITPINIANISVNSFSYILKLGKYVIVFFILFAFQFQVPAQDFCAKEVKVAQAVAKLTVITFHSIALTVHCDATKYQTVQP